MLIPLLTLPANVFLGATIHKASNTTIKVWRFCKLWRSRRISRSLLSCRVKQRSTKYKESMSNHLTRFTIVSRWSIRPKERITFSLPRSLRILLIFTRWENNTNRPRHFTRPQYIFARNLTWSIWPMLEVLRGWVTSTSMRIIFQRHLSALRSACRCWRS